MCISAKNLSRLARNVKLQIPASVMTARIAATGSAVPCEILVTNDLHHKKWVHVDTDVNVAAIQPQRIFAQKPIDEVMQGLYADTF